MKITIENGLNPLKFTAVTPANFGTQWAQATLDSPTQIDAQWGLPFIPDSAIKGVMKADFETQKTGNIEQVFGRPDGASDEGATPQYGKPGSLVFGNANLLSFPFRFLDGKIVQLVHIMTLFYLQKFCPRILDDQGLLNVLLEILAEERKGLFRTLPSRADFSAVCPISMQPVSPPIQSEIQDVLRSLLSVFYSGFDLEKQDFLMAGPKTVRMLWRLGYDQRSQIRMDRTGTAEDASLRRIQLMPSESVFLSVVLNESQEEIVLPDRSALGAWEKSGLGWFKLERLMLDTRMGGSSGDFSSSFDKWSFVHEEEEMARAYRAVSEFKESQRIAEKIRSISNDFSFTMKKSGLESALAFSLAKAKPLSMKVSDEVFAHRWFLSHLLNIEKATVKEESKFPELGKMLVELLLNPPIPERKKIKIATALHWLKRYTEIGFIT